jgi:hypothetical protein
MGRVFQPLIIALAQNCVIKHCCDGLMAFRWRDGKLHVCCSVCLGVANCERQWHQFNDSRHFALTLSNAGTGSVADPLEKQRSRLSSLVTHSNTLDLAPAKR